MAKVHFGEISSFPEPHHPAGTKNVKFIEALQQALDTAPPPDIGDIQSYKVTEISVEYGGITAMTRTRVGIEVADAPLPHEPPEWYKMQQNRQRQ